MIEVLNSWRSYSSLEKIDYLLSQIFSGNRDLNNITQLNQISTILSKMKKFSVQGASASMLATIVEGLPDRDQMALSKEVCAATEKCIRKIILVTLYQKQMNAQFNLLKIHNQIQQRQFRNSDRLYCEFHIQTALSESKNSLKRVFSIMYLIDSTKTKYCIERGMAITVLLMLLSDQDGKVRSYAIQLAEALAESERDVLEVFNKTEKPRSTKKTMGKPDPVSLKVKKANMFLTELINQKQEIIQDRSQLKTFLDRTSHADILEVLLRGLLDLPSYDLKSKFIEVLALVENHDMVFSITFGQTLHRLFSLQKILQRPKLGIEETVKVEGEAKMLANLGKLVNSLCVRSDNSKALVQALVFPLFDYVLQNFPEIEETLVLLSETMFKKVEELDDQNRLRVFYCYLSVQKGLRSA